MKAVPLRDVLQCIDLARTTPHMHTQNAGGAVGDEPLDLRRIEHMRLGIDVAEHRRDLLPLQRVCGGNEGE